MYNLGENNFNELPMQNKWKLISSLVMWWEIIYDVTYLFDVAAVLASTVV